MTFNFITNCASSTQWHTELVGQHASQMGDSSNDYSNKSVLKNVSKTLLITNMIKGIVHPNITLFSV